MTPEKLLAQGTKRFLNLLLEPLRGVAAWIRRSVVRLPRHHRRLTDT